MADRGEIDSELLKDLNLFPGDSVPLYINKNLNLKLIQNYEMYTDLLSSLATGINALVILSVPD